MIKNLTLCLFLALSFSAYSQIENNTELGAGVGVLNYTGDLNNQYKFRTQRPAATVFFKYNINDATLFRASVTGGRLFGTDEFSDNPISQVRAQSFKIFLFEASTVFEYNFINMKTNNPHIFGSPYLFGGIGIAGFSGAAQKDGTYSPIQPVVPLGAGVKVSVTPHIYIGLEFGARITFFDYIDGVSYGDPRFKNFEFGNWYDNDTYYFLNLSASYTFYKIACPKNPY